MRNGVDLVLLVMLLQVCLGGGGVQRAGKQESLRAVAACTPYVAQLFVGLDALGKR